MEILFVGLVFVAGYVAAVYTWEMVAKWWQGAANRAERLREKARAIEKALRD